jgi:hypothetical protein
MEFNMDVDGAKTLDRMLQDRSIISLEWFISLPLNLKTKTFHLLFH